MNYTTEQLRAFPFIVSSDTLRDDHIAVAYCRAIDALGLELDGEARQALEHAAEMVDALIAPQLQECHYGAIEAAEALLQMAAPAGFWFGSHEGDGALIGYWVTDEWRQALEHIGAGDCDAVDTALLITELVLGGIDPDNVEEHYTGGAEGYSEETAGADYAQRLAEDTGAWDPMAGWPHSCIDWGAAWRELRHDGYWLQDLGCWHWAVFRP